MMIGPAFVILCVGAVGLIMNLGGFSKEKILVLSEELLISSTECNTSFALLPYCVWSSEGQCLWFHNVRRRSA